MEFPNNILQLRYERVYFNLQEMKWGSKNMSLVLINNVKCPLHECDMEALEIL